MQTPKLLVFEPFIYFFFAFSSFYCCKYLPRFILARVSGIRAGAILVIGEKKT